jgi:glycosyltransferase involved in cell wall biosynthesis
MSPGPTLTLVIPARNEADFIEGTLRTVSAYLETLTIPWEILVGDSASTDGTGDIVRRLDLPRVRVLRAEQPGKGRVLTRCLAEARGRVVGFLDADLEIPVETVGQLFREMMAGADAAIAAKTPSTDLDRPLRRRVATRVLNGVIRMLFSSGLTDHQAGGKLFRSAVLQPVLRQVETTGWLWDTEVLVRLQARGARIVEVPFSPRPARTTRLGGSDAGRAVRELVGIRLRTFGPPRGYGSPTVAPPAEVPSIRG